MLWCIKPQSIVGPEQILASQRKITFRPAYRGALGCGEEIIYLFIHSLVKINPTTLPDPCTGKSFRNANKISYDRGHLAPNGDFFVDADGRYPQYFSKYYIIFDVLESPRESLLIWHLQSGPASFTNQPKPMAMCGSCSPTICWVGKLWLFRENDGYCRGGETHREQDCNCNFERSMKLKIDWE